MAFRCDECSHDQAFVYPVELGHKGMQGPDKLYKMQASECQRGGRVHLHMLRHRPNAGTPHQPPQSPDVGSPATEE